LAELLSQPVKGTESAIGLGATDAESICYLEIFFTELRSEIFSNKAITGDWISTVV